MFLLSTYHVDSILGRAILRVLRISVSATGSKILGHLTWNGGKCRPERIDMMGDT